MKEKQSANHYDQPKPPELLQEPPEVYLTYLLLKQVATNYEREDSMPIVNVTEETLEEYLDAKPSTSVSTIASGIIIGNWRATMKGEKLHTSTTVSTKLLQFANNNNNNNSHPMIANLEGKLER